MKINWNSLGGGGLQNKNPSLGGSMDTFWNCTFDFSFVLNTETVCTVHQTFVQMSGKSGNHLN